MPELASIFSILVRQQLSFHVWFHGTQQQRVLAPVARETVQRVNCVPTAPR